MIAVVFKVRYLDDVVVKMFFSLKSAARNNVVNGNLIVFHFNPPNRYDN